MTLRTYIYEVWTLSGLFMGWYPTTPQNAVYAYTILSPLVATISGPLSLWGSASRDMDCHCNRQEHLVQLCVVCQVRGSSGTWELDRPCEHNDFLFGDDA